MATTLNPNLLLAIPLAPLAGAAIAGLFGTKFFGEKIGRAASHSLAGFGRSHSSGAIASFRCSSNAQYPNAKMLAAIAEKQTARSPY